MDECEGETEFHSVTNINCKQEGQILDLDEQVDSNPNSNSLKVSKATQQYNVSPIPAFIYTNETFRAICAKLVLPEPIHVSFVDEYDYILEFPTEFELCKIAVDLQQVRQWFGYDVVITYEVVTKDKLNEIEQDMEEPKSTPSLDVTGEIFETPRVSAQQIEQQVERVTQNIAN